MKSRGRSIVLAIFCAPLVAHAHQPLEQGGLVGAMSSTPPAYLQRTVQLIFEKRPDGAPSEVLCVNGQDEFLQFVIAASTMKPVVVMVHSAMSMDAQKMKPIYQVVADTYKDQVIFVSMDLLAQHQGVSENYQLISHFMQQENVNRLELPVMFFVKDGGLYAPAHLPATMLQGFYTQENLSEFVKNKFFQPLPPIMHNAATDMTPTTTGLSMPKRDKSQVRKVSKRPAAKQSTGFWPWVRSKFGRAKQKR